MAKTKAVPMPEGGAYDWREHDKQRPKVLRHIEVRAGEKGGHIVKHYFDHYDHPSEEHIFGKSEGLAMMAHVGKLMGVKEETGETKPDNEADE